MTMYERLMMLPVFKGIGEQQLSTFLEKTHLEFGTYAAGEMIAEKGDVCEYLTCVLSGNIESIYTMFRDRMTLQASYGAGKVIGMTRLYGMDNRYSHSVRALDGCGTMRFTKAHYMELLQENPICLINFLNNLSYRSQKVEKALEEAYSQNLAGRLATIVSAVTDRDCREINIKGISHMCFDTNPCGISIIGPRFEELDDIQTLVYRGLIKLTGDDEVSITSRNDLIEYAESCR